MSIDPKGIKSNLTAEINMFTTGHKILMLILMVL